MRNRIILISIIAVVLLLAITVTVFILKHDKSKKPGPDQNKEGVNTLIKVNLQDTFWSSKQKQVICESIKHSVNEIEKMGEIENFRNASLKNRGEAYENKFYGGSASDSDTYKLVEAMCYAIMIDADGDQKVEDCQKEIKEKLEEWIPLFTGSQDEEGYIVTYFILNEGRWKYFHAHELYVSGHFFEAAIAHYLSTDGKDTRLFDMAIKNADYIYSLFGKDKWNQVPGHQEIELALVRLAQLCKSIGGEYTKKADNYAELAKFFLDARGDRSDRTMDIAPPAQEAFPGEYNQDHKTAAEQTEAVGHAVRALYMYTGMAKVQSWYDDNKYDNALRSLWTDVTQKKSYVTGGVGSNQLNEGFGKAYELDQKTAYCESCASIALMLWDHEMNNMYTDSKYMNNFEHVLYNSFLSGISIDGTKFFYRNPVTSSENQERQDWYEVCCCPPNILRFILSLQNYIYKTTEDGIQMDLFIGNEAEFDIDGNKVGFSVESNISDTAIRIKTENSCSFTLRLRKPEWVTTTSITVNGEKLTGRTENGYIVITREFKNDDLIEIKYGMTLERQVVDAKDIYNKDCVYYTYGPFVYVIERTENENSFNPENVFSPATDEEELQYEAILDPNFADTPYESLNSILKLKVDGLMISSNSGIKNTSALLIPYYSFGNRGKSSMRVYIKSEISSKEQSLEHYAYPDASYTFPGDNVMHLNDGINKNESRWTSYNDQEVYLYPWVKYEFDEEVEVSKTEIYWYDDNGGVRLPNDVTVEYWDDSKDAFVPVKMKNKIKAGKLTIVTFDKVKTREIRLVIDNSKSNHAAGITEWLLFEEDNIELNDNIQSYATPSAVHLFPNGIDSVFNLNDGFNTPESRWTSYNNDDVIPDPWVQYDFEWNVVVNKTIISWYDDRGGVVAPDGVTVLYFEDNDWKEVNVTGGIEKDDLDWTITFEGITTNRIRLLIDNSKTNRAAGITEWLLFNDVD